jgi:hypothetical protein
MNAHKLVNKIIYSAARCPRKSCTSRDVEVLLIQGQEFVLHHITGVYVHLIINEEAMDNIYITFALHGDSLLAIHC